MVGTGRGLHRIGWMSHGAGRYLAPCENARRQGIADYLPDRILSYTAAVSFS